MKTRLYEIKYSAIIYPQENIRILYEAMSYFVFSETIPEYFLVDELLRKNRNNV